MTFLELLALLGVAAGAWLAWSSLRAREAANTAIRSVCTQHALLFLDDTVGLESMWPVRNDDGHLTLRRLYTFEYSDTGHNRRKGSVTVIGEKVSEVSVGIPVPEGETLH